MLIREKVNRYFVRDFSMIKGLFGEGTSKLFSEPVITKNITKFSLVIC